MIVILGAEYFETSDDICEIMQMHPSRALQVKTFSGDELRATETVQKEIIKGRKFIKQNGDELIIGMDRKLQELIGLQYEAFENLQKELYKCAQSYSRLSSENTKIKKEIFLIHEATFFKRLKFLIFGFVDKGDKK